jgi:replicative DNA helicase
MEEYEFDDELNEEEQSKLSAITNPDDEQTEQYSWSNEFQRNIVALLLNDRWFAVQCRDLISPNYFVDETHQLLCRNLFAYLEKWNSIPQKSFVLQEVEDAISNKDSKIKQHYIAETNALYQKYVPNLESREYLLEKILNFAKLMSLKRAFDESLNLMKRNPDDESTWVKIQAVLRDALLVDRNFNEGLNYFETFEERYERMNKEEEAQEIFTSGFKAIDEALLGGGAHRGEIYSWIGLSGTGKSLALVTAALRNIINLGKKVLYVSLEMDEDKIAERFDAQISNIDINQLKYNKDLVKNAVDEQVKEQQDNKLLIIKQFPAGSMTVNTLRAYMQQLQMTGFHPDLLIIDYIGEMKDFPNMPTYESRYRIVRDLRGFATEERICIFTAMQPNKDAREAQKIDGDGPGFIDDTNLADSYGQIRPLDGCWSINQMQNEKEAGIARIFVIKHRHGRSRFSFHVQYNMKTLAMDQISDNKYNEIWKQFSLTKINRTSDMDDQAQQVYKKMKKKKLDLSDGSALDLDNDLEEKETGENNG